MKGQTKEMRKKKRKGCKEGGSGYKRRHVMRGDFLPNNKKKKKKKEDVSLLFELRK